jgi:adenylate kinase family enzyme
LDLYETQTAPLLDYYSRQNRLVQIDGTDTPDAVFASMRTAIDGARRGQ